MSSLNLAGRSRRASIKVGPVQDLLALYSSINQLPPNRDHSSPKPRPLLGPRPTCRSAAGSAPSSGVPTHEPRYLSGGRPRRRPLPVANQLVRTSYSWRQNPGARQLRASARHQAAVLSGLERKRRPSTTSSGAVRTTCNRQRFRPTERPRSRTEPAVGYTTSPVLKTGWGTGPMPLHAAEIYPRMLRQSALPSREDSPMSQV